MRSCERKWYRANNTADFSVDLLCLCCGLSLLSRGDSRVDLLAILPPHTGRGRTVAATLARADTTNWYVRKMRIPKVRVVSGLDVPDDLAVDGAGNAVLELQVHLGDGVLREDRGIRDITYYKQESVFRSPAKVLLNLLPPEWRLLPL